MEFRVEEQGNLLHFYPLTTDKWMVVRTGGEVCWKLYKSIEDVHTYVAEFSRLEDACDAAKGF